MEKNTKSVIEAILFASGEPVEISKLAKFIKISAKDCEKEIENIEKFHQENATGLAIITKGKSVQLVSSKECSEQVAKFLNKQMNDELSRAALEVLSVIAYRGPIGRAGIEEIRGVNCSFTLRNLAMRGLIERRENPVDNRSYLYEVSFDFMKHLGIAKINELPEYEELKKVNFVSAPKEEEASQE